jgi:thiol-disulfide isomerase/thioredoxin
MKISYRNDQVRLFFVRWPSVVILAFCISLSSLFACQTKAKKTQGGGPPARAERVSNWPPKVKQIDEQGLKDLLKPNGRPVLINFWATWCEPCREEFPDLVRIGTDHVENIDLITVSLDESSEIEVGVPRFLEQMRSDSPAYLLKTADQDAAIQIVSKEWQGALPFTILLNAEGEEVYSKQGKFKPDVLVAAIEKL